MLACTVYLMKANARTCTTVSIIKFPFKRKGLPNSSVSMHVKARNVFQVPRPYQGFCSGPKYFIVNCNKTILN